MRANTLLIEQKLVRGQIVAGQKTNRSIRTIKLLAHLAHDLAEYRARTGATGLPFPKPDGGAWLDHDFRNWRKRGFRPATEAIGPELGCTVEAAKLERAIDAAERSGPPEDVHSRVHRAMIDAMRSELAELRHQIDALRDP